MGDHRDDVAKRGRYIWHLQDWVDLLWLWPWERQHYKDQATNRTVPNENARAGAVTAERERDGRMFVVMLALFLAVTACSGSSNGADSGPRIGIPGSGPLNTIMSTLRDRPAGQLHSFGRTMICSEDTTHPIRIDAVTTTPGSTNLVVTGFGTRPNPFIKNKEALGDHLGTASSLGFHSRSAAVCGPPMKGSAGYPTATSELAVTLRSTAPIGRTTGFDVKYVVDGTPHVLTLLTGVTMCTAAATRANPARCGG